MEETEKIEQLEGTVIFRLINEGSKSEISQPFLKSEDGKETSLYIENTNPFVPSELKEYENRKIIVSGFFRNNVFFIKEIIMEDTKGFENTI